MGKGVGTPSVRGEAEPGIIGCRPEESRGKGGVAGPSAGVTLPEHLPQLTHSVWWLGVCVTAGSVCGCQSFKMSR